MTIQAITKNFLNLIYPSHCHVCKVHLEALNETGLCDLCKSQIKRNPKPYSKDKKYYFERAYSACLYQDVLKELIHLFKYKEKIALGRFLSSLMVDFLKNNPEILDGIDMISFVPLQNNRLRERGFNQSRILAFHISKGSGIPLSDTLKKTRRTENQNELSRSRRLLNLNGAFEIKKNTGSLAGLKILLVDDVMTTGATLNECAKTLSEAGAREIICFTLARGL